MKNRACGHKVAFFFTIKLCCGQTSRTCGQVEVVLRSSSHSYEKVIVVGVVRVIDTKELVFKARSRRYCNFSKLGLLVLKDI